MNNLERRALLGDPQAQEECTRRGIVLGCPICGESVAVHGPEDWEPTFHDPDSGGDPYWFECECGLAFGTSCYEFKQALALWNTRPAPPIGRCGECGRSEAEWTGERTCNLALRCVTVQDDYFCASFMPRKEKIHENQN